MQYVKYKIRDMARNQAWHQIYTEINKPTFDRIIYIMYDGIPIIDQTKKQILTSLKYVINEKHEN